MFVKVLSLTYHSPITSDSLTFGPSMNPSSETCSAAMILRMTSSLDRRRLWYSVTVSLARGEQPIDQDADGSREQCGSGGGDGRADGGLVRLSDDQVEEEATGLREDAYEYGDTADLLCGRSSVV